MLPSEQRKSTSGKNGDAIFVWSRTVKVVILAGGLGTRLRQDTMQRPKPMVSIGTKPILWHVMKLYAEQGFNEFVSNLAKTRTHLA